ncbi:MAG TPA: hypothetical protein VKS81_09545 [Bacteroidota bacterium]|nr:hypothetical protein [Bacteroidota bacterium]
MKSSVKYHFDKVQNFLGFALGNAREGEMTKVLCHAKLTSDDPRFHTYINHISDAFLATTRIPIDSVHHLLVLIHNDLSADLYVNDFSIAFKMKAKRSFSVGEAILQRDIIDIGEFEFPGIKIVNTDKIIFCFKVGWRFGLFFETCNRHPFRVGGQSIQGELLDVKKAMLSIGELYRELSFYHLYKVLEGEVNFNEIMKDGWFPFIEILDEFRDLIEAYKDRFDFDKKISRFVDKFDKNRISLVTNKWWQNPVFHDKKPLIEAGITSYNLNTDEGFINCIKNLSSELEGVLRLQYFQDGGKGDGVKVPELIAFIIEKGKQHTVSESSLYFPQYFLNYLRDIVFAGFNIESGDVYLSRHSSSHGVAEPNKYTRDKALQFLLALDQIYYYSSANSSSPQPLSPLELGDSK